MSFIEVLPCKIFALCIVSKGEGIWYLFQQLALSNYQMLWIQVHVLQSFLLRKTAPLIPFILFEQHFMYCISICILCDCNFLKGKSYFV